MRAKLEYGTRPPSGASTRHLVAACTFFICSALVGYADQFGDFTYVEYDTTIRITDFPENAIGDVVIPSEIVGKPVTRIGAGAFYMCLNLTSVTIPDGVTSIRERTFAYCNSLTSITIPDSVTSIGKEAFQFCSSLTSVKIPDNVTSIREEAFSSCSSLTGITIPDGVTNIGRSAFFDCSNLTSVTIGDGVTSIGDLAFHYCSSLTGVTIPDNVTSIEKGAFRGCISLTEITVNASNSAYSSLDGVVFDKKQTSLIIFPSGKGGSYVVPKSVTSIGNWAFANCRNLTSVTIPDSVTSIGEWAFASCTSLIGVTIPDSVTSIGNSAFTSCSNLSSVSIPDSVTSIGSNLSFIFSGCTSLTSVTIPESITSIGDYAFSRCESLTSVYFEGNAPMLDTTPIDPREGGSVHCFLGADNATVYYLAGTTDWGVTYAGRPTAEISVLPDPLVGGAPLYGLEGWFLSEWWGEYNAAFASWLLHAEHGAIYRDPDSTNASMYFYDDAMGAWWWTNESIYPFVYVFDPPADLWGIDIGAEWLFYFDLSTPRAFGVVTGVDAGSFLFFGP